MDYSLVARLGLFEAYFPEYMCDESCFLVLQADFGGCSFSLHVSYCRVERGTIARRRGGETYSMLTHRT